MKVNSSSLSSQKPSYLPRIAIATVVVVGVISVAGVIFGAIAMSTPSQTIASWSSPFDLLSNDLAPDALLFSSICSLSLCTIILASYSLYKSKKNSSAHVAPKTRASAIKEKNRPPLIQTERSDLSTALVSQVPTRSFSRRSILEPHPIASTFNSRTDAASLWLQDVLGYRLFPQPSVRRFKQISIEDEIRALNKSKSQSWLEKAQYPKHGTPSSTSRLKLLSGNSTHSHALTSSLTISQPSEPIKNVIELPDELHLQVLSFLPVQDLVFFMHSSTRCNSIGLIFLRPQEQSPETPGLGLESPPLETLVIAPKIEFAFYFWDSKKPPQRIKKSTPQEPARKSPKVEFIDKILECLQQAGITVDRALVEKEGVISYALLRGVIKENAERLIPQLDIFASKGLFDVVRAICEKQSLSTSKRAQALFGAARGNQTTIVRYLLAGSNPHPNDQARLYARILRGFCEAGQLDPVREYLDRLILLVPYLTFC